MTAPEASASARVRSRPSRVAATEARILAAARELFTEQGYQDATLAAVAERAGVGARTVYLRFGSKGTVLLRAVDAAVAASVEEGGAAGGSGPDGDQERQKQNRPPEPSDPIAAFAGQVRQRYERLGGLVGVLIQASATEPFVADAVARRRVADRRRAGDLVEALSRRGAAPGSVDPTRLADTVAVLASAESWLRLTGPAGCSPGDYQDWLAAVIRSLTGSLLG